MKKAIAYYRKSIEKEFEKSIEGQALAVRTYAAENGIKIVSEYREIASSVTTDRKKLNLLFKQIEDEGDIDFVLVHRFDRMTRDMFGLGYIVETMKKTETKLRSVTEENDFEGDPFKIFMIMMKTFGASIELENISKRMKEGKKKKQQEGGFLGGRPPIGYRSVKGTGILEVEENEIQIVKEVFMLRKKGLSMQKIADELNRKGFVTRKNKQFHPPAIQRILKYDSWYKGNAQAPAIL